MNIKRIEERDSQGEVCSLFNFSLTLPQSLAYEVDALTLFTGQGEDIRVIQPVKKYWEHEASKNRFLLVAGHHKKERTWKELTRESLTQKPFELKRLGGVIVETHCVNTKEQALFTVKQITNLGITSCGIVAPPFHLVRAYTTLLACMEQAGIRIPILPIPLFIAPGTLVPESRSSGWDMMQGEIKRIPLYQEKGDVILYEHFRDYINWLWEQPLVKNSI